MNNPCAKCKRKPRCPEPCYPRRDYIRSLKYKKQKTEAKR